MTTGTGIELYTWHGLCGAYPVPERFHDLMRNRAPASRREALRQLGAFYHWLHQQECSAMAAAVGRTQRAIAKKAKARKAAP